jgi:hypothetical protein
LSRNASAIAIHSTAVFPNPVGNTNSVDDVRADFNDFIW